MFYLCWYFLIFLLLYVCLVLYFVSRLFVITFLMRSYKYDARGKSYFGYLLGEYCVSLLNLICVMIVVFWFLEEFRMKKEIGGVGGFVRERKFEVDNANFRALFNDVEKKQIMEDYCYDY